MPPKTEDEQKQLAAQFREECLSEGVIKPESEAANDEYLLRRFLRARQYDFKASKLMLKNCEDWRGSVGGKGMSDLYKEIDPFDYTERDTVFEHWPLFFHKVDKKGRPVNIHKFGSINATELNKHVTPQRFTDILTVNCEALTREILPACSVAAGKRVETVLVIVDLKGFGISQFWGIKDMVRQSFQISQDYYPETMGQVAIINAPMTFTTMWSAIKPWLAKETVDKVDILGKDYQETLLRLVDAESLPDWLGGSCVCSGPGGCAQSSKGPWLDGRKERREAWIRGERPTMALMREDDQSHSTKDSEKHVDPLQSSKHAEAIATSEPPQSTPEAPPAYQTEPTALPEHKMTRSTTAATVYQTPREDLDDPLLDHTIADTSKPEATPTVTVSPEPSAPSTATPTEGPPLESAESAVSVEPPSSTLSPTSTVNASTAERNSRKSKKSMGSVFSGKSRASSVGSTESAEDASAQRKSRFRQTVNKLVDRMKT